jgi:hypothetical protein
MLGAFTIDDRNGLAYPARGAQSWILCIASSWLLGFAVIVLLWRLGDWVLGRATGGPAPWEGYVIVRDDELLLVSESHPDSLGCVATLEFVRREESGRSIIFPVERISRRQLIVDSVPEYKAAVEARKDGWRPAMRDILVTEYGWSDADAAAVLEPDQVASSPHWIGFLALVLLPLILGFPVRLGLIASIRAHRRRRYEAALERGRCPRCGYDLRGHRHEGTPGEPRRHEGLEAGCPECGWNREENPA